MAERWVFGFRVDVPKLDEVVGSGRSASDVIGSLITSEEDELLEEWGDDPITAEQAIAEITAATLDKNRGYEYRRVTGLIAESVGERFGDEIDVVCTYYLPNDSHGRWNPVLDAIGLPKLAACWGTSNSPFPWKDGPIHTDWPIATILEAKQVCALSAELDAFERTTLQELSSELLVDDGDEDNAREVREELNAGLDTLASWCRQAMEKEWGLLLIMDGSQ